MPRTLINEILLQFDWHYVIISFCFVFENNDFHISVVVYIDLADLECGIN